MSWEDVLKQGSYVFYSSPARAKEINDDIEKLKDEIAESLVHVKLVEINFLSRGGMFFLVFDTKLYEDEVPILNKIMGGHDLKGNRFKYECDCSPAVLFSSGCQDKDYHR